MLKFTCAFMALMVLFSIFYFNKVESRVAFQVWNDFIPPLSVYLVFFFVLKNLKGLSASELYRPQWNEHQMIDEHDEDDQHDNQHAKRKSDILLSLYGLPYTLVDRRRAD